MRTDRDERITSSGSFAGEMTDEQFDGVLGDFKASVHAWSEAAYSRPRAVVTVHRRGWRSAAGWALGCFVAFGSLAGGLYEHQLHLEQARVAAAKQAHLLKLANEKKSQAEDADLLATVDTDVSQAVPSAMEPLAQLMDEDASR